MDRDQIEDVYPLSPAQEGMLFHTLYDPESSVYVEQIRCRLRGDLDRVAFRQAWSRVLDRHPMLRTLVVWKGASKPRQVVLRQVTLPWREEDFRQLPPEEREQRLQTFLREDLNAGFDLSTPPLLRVSVVKEDDKTHHFVWTCHHILLDGWSMARVLHEVSACYDALCRGREPSLPPAPTYRSYVSWLRRRDSSQDQAFWRRYLRDFAAPTPLPGDHRAEAGTSGDGVGDEHSLSLPVETVAALESMARSRRLTINTLFTGTWALLMSRYSGEQDVLFGTTLAGRPPDLPAVEAIVGPFINTVPARVQIATDQSLLGWLKQLQARQSEAHQYEFTPLVQIHEWSEVPRGTPLFETLLVLENYPLADHLGARDQGLDVEDVCFNSHPNYPLTVLVTPRQEWVLKLLSDRRRFEPVVVRRMLSHFQNLLSGIAADPHRPLRALAILSAAQRHQCLVEWNDDGPETAAGGGIHHRFESWAAQTPQQTAALCNRRRLTYGELNRRANQLAHLLRSLGVGPETRVGICLQRSLEMVVGILGILKAGGGFVPLDPQYPRERLAFMLKDADVSILVTQTSLIDQLPENEARVVCLDGEAAAAIEGQSTENPISRTTAHNVAYMIYTSGSTGRAKGVMILHGNLLHYVESLAGAVRLGAAEVYLHTASFSFSSSVRQLLVPLCHGLPVVVATREAIADPVALFELIRTEGVTVCDLVPSYWRNCNQVLGRLSLPVRRTVLDNDLGLILSASEPLTCDVPRFWARSLGHRARLINMFGHTETTGIVSTHPIAPPADERVKVVEVGRPLAKTQIYLLDADLKAIPIGVAGEVYVGGAGVGRGYHRLPGLTADRFIPHPFSSQPGARLYRTGDRARFGPGGAIEFLGRGDAQVKIRGFRIEPGEIEAALMSHPAIEQAAVLVKEHDPGDQRLVAFLVSKPERDPGADELRRRLAASLPDTMIPSAFVMLKSLPLTPSGKVNRSALVVPEGVEPSAVATRVAPRDRTEELIAQIWSEILKVESIGVNDHFFHLGGHSLLATRIISEIRRSFDVELPIRTLFEAPTVAGMAEAVEAKRSENETAPAPPLVALPRNGHPPLSFAQQRLWILNQWAPDTPFYNVPTLLRLDGRLDPDTIRRCLEQIVRRHESLRTTFALVEGEPVQVVHESQPPELMVEDLRHLPEGEREIECRRRFGADAWRPFDLQRGPLLRLRLCRIGDHRHLLLLVMHHIVSDGWSSGILVREISELYRAALTGREPELPALPIQYGDFARWQRQWLVGEVLEEQIAYWKNQLAGAAPRIDLPTDHRPPAEPTFQGAFQRLALPGDLSAEIRALSHEHEVTVFVTLLAAFSTLLYRYTGREDVVLGAPVANRTRSETEGLIGFFANTLVLRTDLSGNPSFRELLARVREVTLGAYAHQDLPFERLVKEIQPARDLSHTPLFNLMLILQSAPTSELRLPNLTVTALEIDVPWTHFDLVFQLRDGPEALTGTMRYSTELFAATSIQRLLRHFERLLEAVVAAPETRIAQLPLISAEEQTRLNAERAAVRKQEQVHRYLAAELESEGVGDGIHTLFEQQVERTPDAVAVVLPQDADRSGSPRHLTYRDLDRRANQLAHHLHDLGVGPEVLVGLCAEPSLEKVVGVLGIFKAGGACLPLEPRDPPPQLAALIAAGRPGVVVSREGRLPEPPADGPRQVLLDRDRRLISERPEQSPRVEVRGENLAWVIRAAGRSVLVEHRSLHRRILGWQELAPASGDVVAHRALAGTLAEIGELFWALLHGGSLVPVAPRWKGEELHRRVQAWNLTVLFLTPSELAAWAPAGSGRETAAATVRRVMVSGSPPQRYAADGAAGEPGSDPVVCRLYDPPEVGTEVGFSTAGLDAGPEARPAGRLAGGIWVHLLDRCHQMVPAGMTGEVFISGETLARGYLGDPRATAERFGPDPVADLPGERLFQAGDLGRKDEQGTLDLLGSMGPRAWVDGHRIDLEAVEATLRTHPLVGDCAVLVHQPTTSGEPEMVACLVLREPLVPARRQKLLEELLPPQSRPQASVSVAALPLDGEGRVDRKALAQVEVVDADLEKSWQEALGSLPEIEEAVVVAQESIAPLPELPLSELVADWRRLEADSTRTSPTAPTLAPEKGPRQRRPALSHGGPLEGSTGEPVLVAEALRGAVERAPERGIVVHGSDGSESFLSYGELLDQAERRLAGLRQLGRKAGDKVIFQLPRGEDFLTAFWGCQLGGMVPVPISVPAGYEDDTSETDKLCNAWDLLERPLIVTGRELVSGIRGLVERSRQAPAQVVAIEDLQADESAPRWHAGRPQDVALLFLTSGSTDLPKAVPQTHRALLSMVAGTCQMNDFSHRDVTLNWMPFDHVGALVFLHLTSVWLGCQQVHAPTATILRQPLLWLDWIDRYRSTISWAPNFAFALINDHAEQIARRSWDLSSMRFLVNAGESVSVPTVRRFLKLLGRHGLPDGSLRPAFGMSETCSGITWSSGFFLAASCDDQRFVELGRPIPGASLRIADAQDQIVEEGTVGRLQVRGPSVMDGYHQNPEANREAFSADGWFTTGDLGLLDDGRLVVTGREKDVIIIHGVNYYCHEIEAVVEDLEGIDVSYTAACAVRSAGSDTDQLAVFFSSPHSGERLAELVQEIRARLVAKTGLAADYLIPVRHDQVPKTAIGKIQRAQLSRRLAQGEFDRELEQLDQLTGNVRTLPAWFFRRIWRRREPVRATTLHPAGAFLVLLDDQGLGEELCAALCRRSQSVLAVERGADFTRLAADRYCINPAEAEHYRRLLAALRHDGVRLESIVHLWSYQEHPGEITGPEDLERGREEGLYSLLFLAQGLASTEMPPGPAAGRCRLQVVSTFTQAVSPHDPIAPEKSPMVGLLKTIAQEMPGWSCRHLDLEMAPPAENARRVLYELTAPGVEHEVGYRGGKRLVCRLEPFHPGREPQAPPPWRKDGMYLISGGLGGVGVEVARFLLRRHGVRLLLVDRAPVPESESQAAARLATCRELQSLPGEVVCEALDVCDPEALRGAVERATARWQCRLDGVLHLAGIARQSLLVAESREALAATLRPKVTGAWVLHQLIADRPEALFISFSSVNGFFGGATAGAYAAANRFLDEFVHVQRSQGFARSYSLAWSMWDEVGMSRGYEMKDLALARGYFALGARQAMDSLLAAVAGREPQMLIGLDAGKRAIHLHVEQEFCVFEKPVAYYTCGQEPPAAERLRSLTVRNRCGRPGTCEFVRLEAFPRESSGEIDRQGLVALTAGRSKVAPQAAPQTEEERLLVDVWRKVLGRREVGIHDNFFQIGGDSILAIQAVAGANQQGLHLAPQDMLRHQTIAELASNLSRAPAGGPEQGPVTGPLPLSVEQRWFFELDSPNVHRHNQDLLVELRQEPDPGHLDQIVRRLLEHHDALRLRFQERDGTWHQEMGGIDDAGSVFGFVDLSSLAGPDGRRALAAAADVVHGSLNVCAGPLLRVVLFSLGENLGSRLLIVIHHLAVDGVSWRILIEDFHTAWQQLRQGKVITLPPKTTSFKHLCQRLSEHARSDRIRRDLSYWKKLAKLPVPPPPVDHPGGESTVAWSRRAAARITPEATRSLLAELPGKLGVRINEILLTALAQAFQSWTGASRLLVDLVVHGRQPPLAGIDLSRTVGWCNLKFPVLLDLTASDDPYEQLRAIRSQLRQIPNDGLAYGLARYMSGDDRLAAELKALAGAEVLFSYFGQFDRLAQESPLFRPAHEARAIPYSLSMRRPQLLSVGAQVLGGVLELSIGYSERLHRRSTIERLVQGYAEALHRLIQIQSHSPDFPESE